MTNDLIGNVRRSGVLSMSVFLIYLIGIVTTAHADDRSPPSGSVEVTLGLYLLDVVAIDDSQQTVTIDLGVSVRWVDPRLADKAGQVVLLKDTWAPNLQLMSIKDVKETRPEVLHISQGGQVEYLQRFVGEIWHSSDLSGFPLDQQVYKLQLFTPGYTPAQIRLVEDPERTGQADHWSLVGWERLPGRWIDDPFFFQPAEKEFAGAAFEFTVHRRRGFYFWKVVFPLSLVVLMAGSVFWIDASNSSSQISVAYYSCLSLVAYRFVIGAMVPEVSYMTRLDRFVLGVSVLVFFVLVAAIWTGRLHASDKVAAAKRVNFWCGWMFFTALLLISLLSFVF